jgi:hypothetical protein
VNIQADYYFGGPVSNASVEVVVYQNPFYHYWFPRRDYSWYYDDLEQQQGRYYYGGPGQTIKREIVKTDATGKATITFDTPRENYNQDFQYRIEARVTDSSRREIVAADTVRVTRQRYYIYPRPERNIYRPKDKVTVDIKALDANEQPVETEGTVKVTRDFWYEIWLDPTGREVKGEELRLLRAKAFPPAPAKGQKPWTLKFRGYQHDDVLTQTLKTDAEGSAQFNFVPDRDGYYRVAWESSQGSSRRGRVLPPVTAQTNVFVATNATTELGYRPGGVEIVVDKHERAFVGMDNPRHDHYRRMFTKEFSTKRMMALRPRMADIADGIVTATASPSGLNDDFNISASDERTVAELAAIIWEACGLDPDEFALEHLPSFEVDVVRRWPSVEKARRLLGWQARIDVHDGIAQTVAWLREAIPQTA